jgi:hypothetical protein
MTSPVAQWPNDALLRQAQIAAFSNDPWEPVADDTRRLKVPGGWLYKHQRVCLGQLQPPATLIFVADE